MACYTSKLSNSYNDPFGVVRDGSPESRPTMSQQPQSQTGVQTGQQIGGQQGMSQGMGGQQMQGRLSPQQRSALIDVARAVEVCSWCADQCIQEVNPNMVECIRLCEDVVELGEAVLALAPRNSRFSQSVVQPFQQAVQACGQECSSHQASHCQECAQVLSQVANSTQQLLQSPAR